MWVDPTFLITMLMWQVMNEISIHILVVLEQVNRLKKSIPFLLFFIQPKSSMELTDVDSNLVSLALQLLLYSNSMEFIIWKKKEIIESYLSV